MFESFKTHKATVISYCSEYDTPETLSKADWDLIPPCVYLLTPFRNFTKSMSEHGLLSQLIPKIKGLNIFLEKAQQDDNENTKGVRGTLASGLQASLNKRFKDVIDLTDKYATVATFIDPHYKDRHFRSNETELQMVKNEVLSMIPKTDNVCENVNFDVVEEPPKSVVRDDFDIEGLLEDESQDWFTQKENQCTTTTTKSKGEEELEKFLEEPILSRPKEQKQQTIKLKLVC